MTRSKDKTTSLRATGGPHRSGPLLLHLRLQSAKVTSTTSSPTSQRALLQMVQMASLSPPTCLLPSRSRFSRTPVRMKRIHLMKGSQESPSTAPSFPTPPVLTVCGSRADLRSAQCSSGLPTTSTAWATRSTLMMSSCPARCAWFPLVLRSSPPTPTTLNSTTSASPLVDRAAPRSSTSPHWLTPPTTTMLASSPSAPIRHLRWSLEPWCAATRLTPRSSWLVRCSQAIPSS